jgi:opacity protein-like surface antigen
MSKNKCLGSYILLLAVLLRPGWVMADAFVAPFAGYSFGASEFSISDVDTLEQGSLKVAESEHIGFMAGITTQDPGNIYFLYSHQESELSSGGNFNPDRLTDLDLDYFHLGGSLFFPQGNFRPYITTSVGLTQMRPGDNFSNETKFSMAVGGGVEYQLIDKLSLFADVRAYATFINGSQSLFCNGGQCRWNVQSDVMWQGQANLGIKLML